MFYIVKAFVPFHLSAIHYYPAQTGGFLPFVYYLAPLGIVLILFSIYRFKMIRKDLIFGFSFYLISIVLLLQFFPVGFAIVAERYSYIPYIGLFFITGKLYCDFTDNKFGNYNKVRRNYLLSLIVIIALVFSYLTYERNKVWKNDIALYDNVVQNNPETGHCYWARGSSKFERNDISGAIADFDNAIKHNYTFPVAYNSLASCYYELDSLQPAMEGFTKAISLDNKYAMAYFNRAQARQKLQDYSGSIDDYNAAINYNVENASLAYNEMSYSQYMVNDLHGALLSINNAIELDASSAPVYMVNKAKMEYLLKDFDNSLRDYNLAIDRKPDNNLAYYGRGILQLSLKDTAGACNDFNKALELGYTKAEAEMNKYCKH